jgi:hypothetical protein
MKIFSLKVIGRELRLGGRPAAALPSSPSKKSFFSSLSKKIFFFGGLA